MNNIYKIINNHNRGLSDEARENNEVVRSPCNYREKMNDVTQRT